MKLRNIIFVSLLTLLSIELLPRPVSDLPAEEKQVVNGTLDLSNEGLTSLEGLNALEDWRDLKLLNLMGNQLIDLPTWIGNLESLQLLGLAENQLSALPVQIGRLTSLRVLNLSHNQLNTLPAQIGRLTKLRGLNLSSNLFSALPAEIGGLTMLRSLHLADNQFITLPAAIGPLTRLQDLNLSNNQLIDLPAWIGGLTSLEILDLSNNQLSALPAEIRGLTRLRSLKLSGNRLSLRQVSVIRNYFQGRNIFLNLKNQQPVPIILEPLTAEERAAFLAEEARAAFLTEKEKTAPLTDQEKAELEQLQAEHECPICHEPMTADTAHRTACGHTFHAACLGNWVSRGTTSCPLCRQDIFTGGQAQRMPIGHNVFKSWENTHLAQKSTHKKKSAVKVAKRTKKEKVAVA
jgi:hypothetical protein